MKKTICDVCKKQPQCNLSWEGKLRDEEWCGGFELNRNSQEAKADAGKLTLSWVPPEIIEAVAKVRQYGNEKYGDPDNWRTVERERYHEAMLRHCLAAWEDVDAKDGESGMPHLWHIATNVAFLLALKEDEQ